MEIGGIILTALILFPVGAFLYVVRKINEEVRSAEEFKLTFNKNFNEEMTKTIEPLKTDNLGDDSYYSG